MNFWQNLLLVIMGMLIGSGAYLLKGFVFGPLFRYKECVGKIRNRLKYYANVLTSPGVNLDSAQESSKACRELSCDLEESYYSIAFRTVLGKLSIIPAERNISESAKNLIYLSNASYSGEPLKNDKAIRSILNNLEIDKTV
ncbi:hypothetical protein KBD11_01835 [Candidatus Saccharibacteria bacterium]|nr:hypothetical protein [Candidatus Saccharibacteria bacterium]